MMDDSEDNLGDDQEFRGFETPENYMSEDSVQENSKEESHKEEEKNQEKTVDSSLPNGTDVIKDDKMEEDEDCDDEDDEEAEKKSEGGGGSAVDEGAPEKTNEMSVENEMSPEEMSNKEEEDEPKTEPTRKRLRSASKEESDEIAGCRSSDEEDFLGFDTPDTSKEEFLKALLDEPESLLDSDAGTPFDKAQMRVTRSLKKPVTMDLSNPDFRKPFEYGWVRELVYRSTSDSALKRNADIYYFTPKGKKVRSFREVAEHLGLNDELSVNHFTFFKGPIGIGDPNKEIIREAKVKPPIKGSEDGMTTPAKRLLPKPKGTPSAILKTTPKSVQPAEQSSKTSLTPRVVIRGGSVPKNKSSLPMKSKLGFKGNIDKKRKSAGPDDVDNEDWSPEPKANPARDVCSIECRLAMGLIPTLQCHICLCLYHPECVGAHENKNRPVHNYVCKNCQSHKSTTGSKITLSGLPPPPPLTPISNSNLRTPLKTLASTGQQKRDTKPAGHHPPRSQSIVGAVTTWLPPSSSVQVSQPNTKTSTTSSQPPTTTTPAPPISSSAPLEGTPQSLVSMNGKQTNGVKRGSSSPVEGASPPPEKKQRTKENSSTGESPGSHPVIQNFMMNLNAGYIALLHAFQYLKVHELLRASCVSHMWRHIASHTTLWETVRMKNSRVRDWEGFGRALSTSGTRFLDLKKMLLPDDPEEIEEMWLGLSKAVTKVKSLKKVDLGRCTPDAVESVALSCPQLESLTSLTIRGLELDMTPISLCSNLTELKLKSVGGIDIKNLHFLAALKELKHLSLTTVKSLNGIETVLSTKLESLELGECSALNESVATVILPKLTNLKRLRLEKGQGPNCPIMPLLNTIATLPNLTLLELINFDVKPGFDKALAKCTNLRTLLIIPTYVTQSATTNHVVMGGVSKLSSTLTYFVWGLTLELLRVTDLFIDQVEGQKTGKPQAPGSKKGSGDSIPILKPLVEDSTSESSNKEGSGGGSGGHTASQVDILALPKLQKVLSTLLPTTKIKILKVPFSATWRQTVSDVPQ